MPHPTVIGYTPLDNPSLVYLCCCDGDVSDDDDEARDKMRSGADLRGGSER